MNPTAYNVKARRFKGTVRQIKKALINDRLHVSKVFSKFRIQTTYKFVVKFATVKFATF